MAANLSTLLHPEERLANIDAYKCPAVTCGLCDTGAVGPTWFFEDGVFYLRVVDLDEYNVRPGPDRFYSRNNMTLNSIDSVFDYRVRTNCTELCPGSNLCANGDDWMPIDTSKDPARILPPNLDRCGRPSVDVGCPPDPPPQVAQEDMPRVPVYRVPVHVSDVTLPRPLSQLVPRSRHTERVRLRYQGPAQPTVDAANRQRSRCPHVNDTSPLAPLRLWQDPSLWNVPSVGGGSAANITLPANTSVLINAASLAPSGVYARIHVPPGSALVLSDANIHLRTHGIVVHAGGALVAGSETCKLRSTVTITLVGGTKQSVQDAGLASDDSWKGIVVSGRLDLHSVRYSSTWTRLAQTAMPGDTAVVVQEPLNWDVGQRIVITTSQVKDSRDFNRNEVRVVTKVTVVRVDAPCSQDDDGLVTLLTLDSPLQYRHTAEREYQVEVGLLSRRLVVQGDDASQPIDTAPVQCRDAQFKTGFPCPHTFLTGYGGHIKVVGQRSEGRVSGVELYRMGQTNQLGRYPFHLHLVVNGSASYLEDSSVWRSFYRCVSIHGTNSSTVTRNVAFDVIGHCYYLEDGVEEWNTLSFNLAAHMHILSYPPTSSNQFLTDIHSNVSSLRTPVDTTASGFYVSNNYNRLYGNAVSGGYSGYSMVELPRPIGHHATSHAWMAPSTRPMLEFDGNSCHSSGFWWIHGSCFYIGGILTQPNASNGDELVYNPGRTVGTRKTMTHNYMADCDGNVNNKNCHDWTRFTNIKAFLCGLGMKHWGNRPEVSGFEAHDFARLSVNIFGSGLLTDMLIVCRTPHAAHVERPYNATVGSTLIERRFFEADDFHGFSWYDTGQRHIVSNVTFRGCGNHTSPPSFAFRMPSQRDDSGPELMSTTRAIVYENCTVDNLHVFGEGDMVTNTARLNNFVDQDGSATLRSGPTIAGSSLAGNWWHADRHCHQNDAWNLVACDMVGSRFVGSMELEAFPSVAAAVNYCGPKNANLPCPVLGHANHFGWNGPLNAGLPLTFEEKLTGLIGGYGWHISYLAGAPRRLEVSKQQLPNAGRNGSLVIAVTYPPHTSFNVTAYVDGCNPSNLCELRMTLADNYTDFDGSFGSKYFVDVATNNLFFMVTPQGSNKISLGPTNSFISTFERQGFAMSDAASKHRIVVEANCTTTTWYGEDNFCANVTAVVPRVCPGDLVHEGIDACVPITDSSDAMSIGDIFQELPTFRSGNASAPWKQALPLLRLHCEMSGSGTNSEFVAPNMFAGSVLNLASNTTYAIRLTLTDPDGIVNATGLGGGSQLVEFVEMTTRFEPPRLTTPGVGGTERHVYSSVFQGSRAAPSYGTLEDAYRASVPGDVITIHGGVHYPANASVGFDFHHYAVPATAGLPLVIRSDPTMAMAVLDGNRTNATLMDLSRNHHHVVDHVAFRSAQTLLHLGDTHSGVSHLVLRQCLFDSRTLAVFVRDQHWGVITNAPFSRYITVLECDFIGHKNNWRSAITPSPETPAATALRLTGQGHVVARNRFTGFRDAFALYRRIPLDYDFDLVNAAIDVYDNDVAECDDDAVQLDFGFYNIRFMYNYVHRSMMGISCQPVYGGPAYIYRNVVYNIGSFTLKTNGWPSGLLVFHNTFAPASSAATMTAMWQNSQFINNLFVGTDQGAKVFSTGTPLLDRAVMDYNAYHWHATETAWKMVFLQYAPPDGTTALTLVDSKSFTTFSQFQAAYPFEAHGMATVDPGSTFQHYVVPNGSDGFNYTCRTGPPCVAPREDPVFVSPTSAGTLDLRLLPSAPIVDMGLRLPNLNDDFAGAAPDIGAFELGAEPWLSLGPPAIDCGQLVHDGAPCAGGKTCQYGSCSAQDGLYHVDYWPTAQLVWGVDSSFDVMTPPAIARGDRGLPATQYSTGNNGRVVNVYGGKGRMPHTWGTHVINGGIPQLGNVSEHIWYYKRDLAALIPDVNYSGYCLVDFEHWRADWNSTGPSFRTKSLNLTNGDVELAQSQYETAAKTFMLATIAATREVRPGCLVGWYGYPRNRLPFIPTVSYTNWCSWEVNAGACFFDGYDTPSGDAQRALNDDLLWLFEALDVVTPTIYLGILPNQTTVQHNADYVRGTVQEAARMATKVERSGHRRPAVMPYTWYVYNNYWQVPPPSPREMLSLQDSRVEFKLPLQYGADGIVFWGAVDRQAPPEHTGSAAALQNWVDTVLSVVVGEIEQEFTMVGNYSAPFVVTTTAATTAATTTAATTTAATTAATTTAATTAATTTIATTAPTAIVTTAATTTAATTATTTAATAATTIAATTATTTAATTATTTAATAATTTAATTTITPPAATTIVPTAATTTAAATTAASTTSATTAATTPVTATMAIATTAAATTSSTTVATTTATITIATTAAATTAATAATPTTASTTVATTATTIATTAVTSTTVAKTAATTTAGTTAAATTAAATTFAATTGATTLAQTPAAGNVFVRSEVTVSSSNSTNSSSFDQRGFITGIATHLSVSESQVVIERVTQVVSQRRRLLAVSVRWAVQYRVELAETDATVAADKLADAPAITSALQSAGVPATAVTVTSTPTLVAAPTPAPTPPPAGATDRSNSTVVIGVGVGVGGLVVAVLAGVSLALWVRRRKTVTEYKQYEQCDTSSNTLHTGSVTPNPSSSRPPSPGPPALSHHDVDIPPHTPSVITLVEVSNLQPDHGSVGGTASVVPPSPCTVNSVSPPPDPFRSSPLHSPTPLLSASSGASLTNARAQATIQAAKAFQYPSLPQ